MNFARTLEALRNDELDKLLSEGDFRDFDFRSRNTERYRNWFSGIGATLLQLVSFLKPELAPKVLDLGSPLDFHSACALGKVDYIREILKSEPNIIHSEVDGYLPIQYATRSTAAFSFLLENGVDPNRKTSKLAWFEWEDQAAEEGISDWRIVHMIALGHFAQSKQELLELLKNYNADLAATAQPFGDTALHLCAIYDRADTLEWFVRNGISVDVTSSSEMAGSAAMQLLGDDRYSLLKSNSITPLMCALAEGMINAVQMLLELGADVNQRDGTGLTPLHYAAGALWKDKPEIVRILIEKGARVDIADDLGRKPIDLAKSRGHSMSVKILSDQNKFKS